MDKFIIPNNSELALATVLREGIKYFGHEDLYILATINKHSYQALLDSAIARKLMVKRLMLPVQRSCSSSVRWDRFGSSCISMQYIDMITRSSYSGQVRLEHFCLHNNETITCQQGNIVHWQYLESSSRAVWLYPSAQNDFYFRKSKLFEREYQLVLSLNLQSLKQ